VSKPETSFIAGVSKYLTCYAEKMHNPYRGGTPDVWYSGRKRDLWVEYKFVVLPARDDTKVVPNLSALQLHWLKTRRVEGRNVLVIVGCRDGGVVLDDPPSWEFGLTTKDFRSVMLSRKALAEFISTFVN
jgi:hypothetical protein